MEADIIRSGANEVTASPASDWLRDISGSHFQPLISLNQSEAGLAVTSLAPLLIMSASMYPHSGQFFTNFHKPYLRSAEEDRLAGGLI